MPWGSIPWGRKEARDSPAYLCKPQKVPPVCHCRTKFRTTASLWKELGNELVELIQSKFLDPKEWSDCGKATEDLLERYFGLKLYLNSGIWRVVALQREACYGCIRSWKKVKANGGRCLSS